jgi:hypothetical protein
MGAFYFIRELMSRMSRSSAPPRLNGNKSRDCKAGLSARMTSASLFCVVELPHHFAAAAAGWEDGAVFVKTIKNK